MPLYRLPITMLRVHWLSGDRTGDFPGMLKERTFNVVKVSKDQPQPFDLKAKGTTVKYDGKAQTVKL